MSIGINGIDTINTEYIRRDSKQVKKTEKSAETFASEDKVEISSKALDLKVLQVKAMQTPDVREQKVAEIKNQVDNGTYQISNERVAERLIEDHILE